MAPDWSNKDEGQTSAAPSEVAEIDSLNTQAWNLRERDPDQARQIASQVLELINGRESGIQAFIHAKAQALITLGEMANNADSYSLALTHLQQAYALLQGQLFPDLLAHASDSIGWSHFRLGNFEEAAFFMTRALTLFHDLGFEDKEAGVLTSFGVVCSNTGNIAQAIENFQKALQLQANQANSRGKGVTLNNLAHTQIKMGAADDAILNATAAITIFHDLGLQALEARAQDTLGKALLGHGDYEKAEQTLQECLAQARRINSEHIEMEAMLNLGKVYQQQGRLELAIDHFRSALQLAQERKSDLYQYRYHQVLAELYEMKGDLAASLQHYKAFHAAMELDLASATSYRMENLKIMHEVEKKRKAAEILWLNNRTLEREIDDRRRVHAELELLATADPLTGLFNRRHFFTLGNYELGKAYLEQIPLSMIMLDIDHFKQVNDTYGHATGDLVLVEISKRIVENSRKGDVCFRYGGEEFVVLLPNTRLEFALEAAERIRNVLSGLPIQIEANEIKVSASLGVAQADLKDNKLANVIDKADQALYRAKAIGRNQISV